MPIRLKQELIRVDKVVRLDLRLPGDQKDWMAWWYSGIYKNCQATSQPNALVAFRELSDSCLLSDAVIYKRVPLTALGQLRIGTVWRESVCQEEAVFKREKFTVDFTPGSWSLTSFHKAKQSDEAPYPKDVHPLAHDKDRNLLLEFKLPSGGKLIVPCLEFFTRCYGRSAELRRVLVTYPWQECKEKRLYASFDEPEEPGKWKVKLTKRLVNGDVLLLAHAKYDPYTEQIVKRIYANIEAEYDPLKNWPAFVGIAPWFQGPAELVVKGNWFDDGRSFLALQIAGCSEPSGAVILRGRENTNLTDQPADAVNGQLGEAWAGTPGRKLVRPPDIIDITGDVEPDPDAISVEIEDPEFEVPGVRRTVIDMRKECARSSSGPKVTGTNASAVSSGEAGRSGQGVGYVSIQARSVMEFQGVLRDMWNAMLFLKKKRPELIQSVECFTFEDGYQQKTEPNLIDLHPFSKKEEIAGAIRNWPYMDSTTLQDVRGALIVRLIVQEKPVHIVEIQRRQRKKKETNSGVTKDEEAFKGLVFILDDQSRFEGWIRQLLSDVRHVKGVVQKLVEKCPGRAAAFKHSPAGSDEVPCEAVVLNALNKMGVDTSS